MAEEPTDASQKKQKTQPRPRKKGKKMPEPFDIPVPSKDQIMGDFEEIASATDDTDHEDNG